jgi:hypothetical protein
MVFDIYTKVVLTIIATALSIIALTTLVSPVDVYAELNDRERLQEIIKLYGNAVGEQIWKDHELKQEIRNLSKKGISQSKKQIDRLDKIYESSKNLENMLLYIQHYIQTRNNNASIE